MSKKKIVLLIVEGPSDDEALSLSLTNLFENLNNDLRVKIVFGDITSDSQSSPSNIVRKVSDVIKKYRDSYRLTKNDISEIIQITDTDGTFIPEGNVLQDSSCEKTRYSLNSIVTADRNNIIKRNLRKSKNLRVLRQQESIQGIPYHIVYMSSNLDHVLYDVLNSSDDEKENNSFSFNEKYHDDLVGFWNFISKSSFSVDMDFVESWKFIEENLNSLQRFSNLHVVLPPPPQVDSTSKKK